MAPESKSSGLFGALDDVTERIKVLIREEIELAKAELISKLKHFAGGVAVGLAAGIFLIAALLYFGHAAAWGIWEISGWNTHFWFGFVVVGLILVILAVVAGIVASQLFKSSTPPTPDTAIQEAQRIKDSIAAATGAEPSATGGESPSTGSQSTDSDKEAS